MIVGYFAWVRTNRGAPEPEKYDAIRETNWMPETRVRYAAITIEKYPLSEEEWELSLDELAKRYPCGGKQ